MRLQKLLDRMIPRYARFPLLLTLALNCAVYWGSRVLSPGLAPVNMTIPWDARVPFWPPAIAVYVLAYVFWAVNYILIARESRARCMRVLAADWIAKALCLPFFLFLPTALVRPEAIGEGVWMWMLRLIYALDTPDNLFPSIHCLESWICWRGLFGCGKTPRAYKAFSLAFALMICASTVLVRQHVLVDIPAGILLSELGLLLSRLFRIGGRDALSPKT